MTLDGIEIPDDLWWTDEYAWTPYEEERDYALDGAQHIELSTEAQAGRPITLEGARNRAWAARDTLDALHARLHQTSMTLILPDTREFTVGWRHMDGPIEATPFNDHARPDLFHSLILRLRTV